MLSSSFLPQDSDPSDAQKFPNLRSISSFHLHCLALANQIRQIKHGFDALLLSFRTSDHGVPQYNECSNSSNSQEYIQSLEHDLVPWDHHNTSPIRIVRSAFQLCATTLHRPLLSLRMPAGSPTQLWADGEKFREFAPYRGEQLTFPSLEKNEACWRPPRFQYFLMMLHFIEHSGIPRLDISLGTRMPTRKHLQLFFEKLAQAALLH